MLPLGTSRPYASSRKTTVLWIGRPMVGAVVVGPVKHLAVEYVVSSDGPYRLKRRAMPVFSKAALTSSLDRGSPATLSTRVEGGTAARWSSTLAALGTVLISVGRSPSSSVSDRTLSTTTTQPPRVSGAHSS